MYDQNNKNKNKNKQNKTRSCAEIIRALLCTDDVVREAVPVFIHEATVVLQSGLIDNSVSSTEEETLTEVADDAVTIGKVSYPDIKAIRAYELADFFARPIVAATGTFPIASLADATINLWDLWSANEAVRSKLRNFMYFRGTLCYKISITGTAFNYGHIVASYQPFSTFNEIIRQYEQLIGVNAGYKYGFAAYLTQGPFATILDLKDNTPVIVKVPFISPKTYFRIEADSASSYPNGTAFVDFFTAGKLYIRGINPTASASSDYLTDPTYNIEVWAEDVQLTTPTATKMIVGQARGVRFGAYGKTEFQDPPTVSSITSAVADAAGALSSIPFIAPLTRPVEMFARGLSKVASLFGWSKPLQLEGQIYVKGTPYVNGAPMIGIDTAQKLAMDPKNSLVMNGVAAGSQVSDELAMSTLCSRESLVSQFAWSPNDTPMVTTLFRPSVSPVAGWGLTTAVSANESIQPSSLMFAVTPFKYWRGSITYRFRVACSQFHRGKLCICFEPNIRQVGTIIGTTMKLNEHSCMIVDIQDSQDFTVTVEWNSDAPWLLVGNRNTVGTPNSVQLSPDETTSLGFLRVTPLNNLISASATDDVLINVFVSSSDMQCAFPTTANFLTRTIAVQSGKVVSGNEITQKHADRWMGESVPSLRCLLKRYVTSMRGNLVPGVGDNGVETYFAHFPPLDAGPTSISSAGTGGVDNYFNYMRYAFLAVSGSYRHRYRLGFGARLVTCTNFVAVKNSTNSADLDNLTVSSTMLSGAQETYMESKAEGSCVFHPYTNGGVEIDHPFYSQNQFYLSFNYTFGVKDNLDAVVLDGRYIFANASIPIFASTVQDGAADVLAINVDSAAGEDFNFSTFMGAPPVWYIP